MISSDKLSFIGILWDMTVSISGSDFKRCLKDKLKWGELQKMV